MMSRMYHSIRVGVRLVGTVIAISLLYVVVAVLCYPPLETLCELLNLEGFFRGIFLRAPLLVAVLIVSLIASLMPTMNRRIVVGAAVTAVLLFGGDYLLTELYYAFHISESHPSYGHLVSVLGQLLTLLLLAWASSGLMHRLAGRCWHSRGNTGGSKWTARV